MAKRIVVLGSTGSIGRQTLAVAAALGERVEILALAAGANLDLLRRQAQRFRPRFVGSSAVDARPDELRDLGCHRLSLKELAELPDADLVVVATVGIAGLAPVMAAARAGKTIALANKEVLVAAGEQITAQLQASGGTILPIDSEHSAIWQCLRGEDVVGALGSSVARLILTASGGPFRDLDRAALARVTPEQALHHPTWEMGRKVTVDSATLLNKGLEVIEARWLFDVPTAKIDVILHRESIVHSMVEFVDRSIKAQLGVPDMRLPIQYALTYPERVSASWPKLDLTGIGRLSFGEVDLERFPCLRLAREAAEKGGTYPAVLSASGEIAVEAFLARDIAFTEVPAIIERALDRHQNIAHPGIADVIAADSWARDFGRGLLVRSL